MAQLAIESQLISKLSELINNLEIDIKKEKKFYSKENLKWAMSKLDPDYKYNHTAKEINEFQSKYKIDIYDQEYRTEAAYYIFYKEVEPNVIGNAKELKEQIIDAIDTGNIDRVIELVENKIQFHHQLKQGDFGREYFDLNYKSNRFSHRFEVIWFYNERNSYRSLKLKNPDLPPSLDNIDVLVINFFDYPFLGIELQQWIDFEKAFRFIPLLKEFLQFLHISRKEFVKYNPKYSLDNVFKKINRFPDLFKDAKHCELFFYCVQFLPINNKVDWSYLFEILEQDLAFKRKIQPNQYINLVKKSFSRDLKQLRTDTSNTKFDRLNNLYRENKKTFDDLVKSQNH
jgi:hypothetical protein